MLNLFPIQFLALFAYFILRLSLGILLLHIGNKVLLTRGKGVAAVVFGTSCIAIGSLFILGYLTQLAALLTILLGSIVLSARTLRIRYHLPDRYFWLLVISVSVSLFITGAGVFAIDLPI